MLFSFIIPSSFSFSSSCYYSIHCLTQLDDTCIVFVLFFMIWTFWISTLDNILTGGGSTRNITSHFVIGYIFLVCFSNNLAFILLDNYCFVIITLLVGMERKVNPNFCITIIQRNDRVGGILGTILFIK